MIAGGLAGAKPVEIPAGAEADLWSAYRAAPSARLREQIFERHAPFARLVAAKHFRRRRGGDIEFEDMCQHAYTGLLEAIDHYDLDRGVPFRGYAHRRIAGSIIDGVGRSSELREQLSFRQRVRRERVRSLGIPDAERLGADTAMQALIELAVGLAVGFMLEDTGLYANAADAERRPSAYDSLAWKETLLRLAREVTSLPDREQMIIRRHYGDGLTFDQLGELLGVSKGRISQLHRGALSLLRKRLRRAGEFRLER